MWSILCTPSVAAITENSLQLRTFLSKSALPNQGRTKEQWYRGVGTYGSGGAQQAPRNEGVARLLYMHECNPAALRAGPDHLRFGRSVLHYEAGGAHTAFASLLMFSFSTDLCR